MRFIERAMMLPRTLKHGTKQSSGWLLVRRFHCVFFYFPYSCIYCAQVHLFVDVNQLRRTVEVIDNCNIVYIYLFRISMKIYERYLKYVWKNDNEKILGRICQANGIKRVRALSSICTMGA